MIDQGSRDKRSLKHELKGLLSRLEQSEVKVDYGRYRRAKTELAQVIKELEQVQEIKGEEEVENENEKALINCMMIRASCLFAFCMIRMGLLDNALEEIKRAELIATRSSETCAPESNMYIVFTTAMLAYAKGDFTNAIKAFKEIIVRHDKNSVIKKYKGLAYRYLGSIHRIKGETELAEEYYSKSLACFEERKDKVGIALSYNSLGSLYQNKGEYTKAKEYFSKSLELLKTLGSDAQPLLAGVLNNMALLYQENQAYEKAIALSLDSLGILKDLNDERGIAMVLTNLGVLYFHSGDYINAEKYLLESIELKKKTQDERNLALSLTNLGVVLFSKGDIFTAKEYFLNAKEILEKIHDTRALADIYENLGDVNKRQGHLKDAISMYEKSYEYRLLFKNPIDLAKTYLNMILVYLDLGDFEHADLYYNELKKLTRERAIPSIKLFLRFAKAMMLKSSSRLAHKFQAMTVFKSIVSKGSSDFELLSLSLQNLCEILFLELSVTGNMEVLQELEMYTSRLQEIVEITRSYIILTETLLLKGKLALIHYDLAQAKSLFSQAERIAQEKGLEPLAALAAREYDRFLGEISTLSEMFEKQATIQERLKYLNIEEQIQELVSPSVMSLELRPEKPILFLLMRYDSGISLHSRWFHESSELDENLISSFLTAMNFFSQEAFSTAGQLERIIYQENTLIMKQEQSLVVCYVFKGESYVGVKTVQTFIEELKKDTEFFNHLLEETEEGMMTLRTKQRINKLIDKIVLKEKPNEA